MNKIGANTAFVTHVRKRKKWPLKFNCRHLNVLLSWHLFTWRCPRSPMIESRTLSSLKGIDTNTYTCTHTNRTHKNQTLSLTIHHRYKQTYIHVFICSIYVYPHSELGNACLVDYVRWNILNCIWNDLHWSI